nr:PREDICTED: G1/S-specific cyclin-D3-like [Bemisia tabaci]
MDLLCSERISPDNRFAETDRVVFGDVRVLNNLLDSECGYVPRVDYFEQVQSDIKPFMRKMVTTWMLEVCEEQRCEDQVFPLAVNFLDRFLCSCDISRRQLQLISAVCLLLASKVRQCHALSVELLCYYSDNSISQSEMRTWELLALSRLEWDLSAVTGSDFVDHILERVTWPKDKPKIRSHSHTLVALCCTEPDLMRVRPSQVAAASLVAAVRGLHLSTGEELAWQVGAAVGADRPSLERMVAFVESLLSSEMSSLQHRGPALASKPPPAPSGGKLMAAESDHKPETPTDVQDIHF